MLKYRRIIQDSARRIADAANRAVDDYIMADAENQAEFTGIMLGRIKTAMDGHSNRGVRWTAKTLTSHSPNARDNTVTADFLGVVEFELPEYRVKKGFLAQVRRIERGLPMAPHEWDRLADQCKQMLAITAESYVFVCARSGIVVVPALAIASGTAPRNPHDFYSRTALRFYEDHFECFVGDLEVSSADTATLQRLKARYALYLGASPIEPVADLQMQLGKLL
ncbi:MAG TPA: hypothetical protein VMR33_15435 [Candidatus Baltobacteraceae bacterium]|jgi:hypothetical protein|nr:hypothetical protein [Candidatus Baltobacteraceae bacterium]